MTEPAIPEICKFSFKWSVPAEEIEKAAFDVPVASPLFDLVGPTRLGIRFRLRFFPKGLILSSGKECRNTAGIYLQYVDGHGPSIVVPRVTFWVRTSTENKHQTFLPETKYEAYGAGIGKDSFLPYQTVAALRENRLLIEDKLNIEAVIEVTSSSFQPESLIQQEVSCSCFSPAWNEVESDNPQYSDFEIISSDGKSFRCHRLVLSAQSPYFQRMFASGMNELQTRKLTTKFGTKSLREILSYLYTGSCSPKMGNLLLEILDGAEYFDLSGLKKMCHLKLAKRLKKTNAVQSLILADRYNLWGVLGNISLHMIVDNMDNAFEEAVDNDALSASLLREIAKCISQQRNVVAL